MPLRILVDEDVDFRIVRELESHGIDTIIYKFPVAIAGI